jgi:F-type H+-transporting ATPase subunit gamma
VSKQAQQRSRLGLYRELNEIVGAMKNMAEVELRRTLHIEHNQKEALATVMEGMTLLLQAVPGLATAIVPSHTVLLVLGSERGFCGGFNEQLAREFERKREPWDEILVMGGRLAIKLGKENNGTFFPGPATVDEILPCIQQLMAHLSNAPAPLRLSVFSHGERGPEQKQLIPCTEAVEIAPAVHVDVTCKHRLLFEQMQWLWVYQGLFRTMLVSLLRENRMRLQQMEGAREHLDTLITNLLLHLNTLRQQEIVEEIEMILVSQDAGNSG